MESVLRPERIRIHTTEAPAPLGPYSQAICAQGMLFIAGQIPRTPTGEQPDSFEEQVEQTFRNLQAVARAGGCELSDAVRIGVYLRDMGQIAKLNQIYPLYFSDPLPARTTIQSNLPGFEIEVDAILIMP
ncbi:MAG: Rid family detoxifying hydrolase [Candidatus Dormibacteraceae bacterium]